MNCLIIAGEKSGEEHCLSFFDQLKSIHPQIHFWGVGGDELQERGMELLYHLKNFSSWGFSEVILKIPFYFKALNHIENEVKRRNCKVAILIDFQDFNLRLAKRLKKLGVEVLYFVAPQAWVWKPKRAQTLQKTVNTLFSIIPFEKNWFKERGVKRIVSTKHPVLTKYEEELSSYRNRPQKDFKKEGARITLLPGSRNFEVKGLLPLFWKTIEELKKEFKLHITLIPSPNVNPNLFSPYDQWVDEIIESEKIGEVLKNSDFCLAASGTATLTTALFSVPTVVCYKSSLLNEYIYLTFLNYNGPVSLANIVHEKYIFPELIQNQASVFNMAQALRTWLKGEKEYIEVMDHLSRTQSLLSGGPENVAQVMADTIQNSYSKKEVRGHS